ncbi:hypothetical protein ACHAWO_002863 [Cyclotella atomus]|jgi:hypothetical protein|uniref:Uncharacterized protein n=1 Tax=Cyclotella atomus TaxID=382360 RepID=A0ABD3QIK8_9STRA
MPSAFAFIPYASRCAYPHRLTHTAFSIPVNANLDTSIQHGFDAVVPTLWTSYTVFDGSELTDTVVVSNSFWSTLSSKLPALLLAEVLASLAFVAIASVLIAQGKFLLDVTSNNSTPKKSLKGKEVSIDLSKLLICIVIDILGSANEAIPVVGEVVDVLYAPMAALLLRQLFQGSNVVFLLEFVEEILPFTDILPLATICWTVETFFGSGNLARALRIGEFASNKTIPFKKSPNESPIEDAIVLKTESDAKKRSDDSL